MGKEIKAMASSLLNGDHGLDSGSFQPQGEIEAFIAQGIIFAHLDISGRKAGKIRAA